MKTIANGTVSSPLGFKTAAINCGIRREKLDAALLYSIVPAVTAGVFTRNRIVAAPVTICRRHMRAGTAQAIIVNSGNANCCTGAQGMRDAQTVVSATARSLEIPDTAVLPASTGVIGKRLPAEALAGAVPELVKTLNFDTAAAAATAIMTTDRFPKQTAVEFPLTGATARIGAMAKGAGMICPHMATMLCFITTDAAVERGALRQALRQAVAASFNRISVDGDMSTNDTVLLLANGLAENQCLDRRHKDFSVFTAALTAVCRYLALQMVEDGEGASKIIEVIVEGAASAADAQKTARRIADSALIKTMVAGENPNWGRIPAAVGASGARFVPDALEIAVQDTIVYRRGEPAAVDAAKLRQAMAAKNVQIRVRLHNGEHAYQMWASDMTAEYVRINTEYN